MSGIRIGTNVTEDTGMVTHGGLFRIKTWTEYEPERRVCSLDFRFGRVNFRWQLILDFSCGPE